MRRTRRRGVGHEGEGGQAVVLILLVVLVMGIGGWVAAYAGANGKVPRGTTVAGIEIGGRDRTAAAAALARGLHSQGQDPITVAVGTVTTQVAPEEAGLSIDDVATVAKALGPRSWDPRELWRYYGGGDELAPVVHVDYRKLDGLLNALDELAGQPARDAGISLSRRPDRPHQASERRPDRPGPRPGGAGRQLRRRASTTVRLPLLLTQPNVDEADLDNALTTIANPAVSGPVTLAFAGSQVTLAPRQYADLLSLVDQDGALTLDVDSAGLAALVNPAAQATQPVDATVALQNGAPAVVKAVAGQTYDEAGVTAAFLQGVTADGAARTVPVKKAAKTKATFTTKDAKQPRRQRAGRQLHGVGAVDGRPLVRRRRQPALRRAAAPRRHVLVQRPGRRGQRLRHPPRHRGLERRLPGRAHRRRPDRLADVRRRAAGGPRRDGRRRHRPADAQRLVVRRAAVGAAGLGLGRSVDAWSTKEFEVSASTGARYAPTPRATVPSTDPACVASAGADGFTVDLVRTVTRISDATPVRSDTVTTTYQPEQAVVCQPAP